MSLYVAQGFYIRAAELYDPRRVRRRFREVSEGVELELRPGRRKLSAFRPRGRYDPGVRRRLQLSRTLHCCTIALALSLGACGERDPVPTSEPGAAEPRLNVLMIVIDDLRPDLGAYGHSVARTPHIDRLAARSLRFDRAYCQFPSCNPSRTSFLTGLDPWQSGVLDNETYFRTLLPDAVTLPELFKNNGYTTAGVGKVFHGTGRRKEFVTPRAWSESHLPRGQRRENPEDARARYPFASGQSIGWLASSGTDEQQTDGRVALQAVEILERLAGEPFFVGIGFLRPHTPLAAPSTYFDLYPLESLRPLLAGIREERAPPSPGTSWTADFHESAQLEIIRAYLACISFVDAQVGKILDTLDRLDLWANTVVVLLSDHGAHLGEGRWWSKNALSEVAARVPLLMHVPSRAIEGSSTDAIVGLTDLYPTLADLAGLVPPEDLAGTSLRPLLDDPQASWQRAALTAASHGEEIGFSVRTDRWRYSEWAGSTELYDLEADPDELDNLVDSPELRETVEELRAEIESARGSG